MDTTAVNKILSVQFEGELLIIHSDQDTYKWKIAKISKKLSLASESERNNFIISPSGYGIHWPQLDEDLSMNGLLYHKK